MFVGSIAISDPIELSKQVEEKYKLIRQKTNKNKSLNEVKLPVWKAADILHHFRYHNTDPEIQHWLKLNSLQQIMKTVVENSLVEKNDITGKERINERQFKIYLDAMKQHSSVSKENPKKMAFYQPGRYLNNEKQTKFISKKRTFSFNNVNNNKKSKHF